MNKNELRDVARETSSMLRRVRWNNDIIDKLFGRRSANEIIAQGDVFYMKHCLDFALAALKLFSDRGVDGELVAEIVKSRRPSIHFIAQTAEGYIHNTGLNSVAIDSGEYCSSNELKSYAVCLDERDVLQTAFSDTLGLGVLAQRLGEIKRKNSLGLYSRFCEGLKDNKEPVIFEF